jgi:hypothetical protein
MPSFGQPQTSTSLLCSSLLVLRTTFIYGH